MVSRVVTYTSEFSINCDPLHDMLLGSTHSTVGNNSSLRTASAGDLVIITAGSSAQIVQLSERLICTLWQDAGGCLWEHNFKYLPLTQIFEKATYDAQIRELYSKHGSTRNPVNFFNSRLHSHDLVGIVKDLVAIIRVSSKPSI